MIKKYLDFISEDSQTNFKMTLPKDIIDINIAYKKAGRELYLVGGAVRDLIMGVQPNDYDLVTNALPEESKKILNNFHVSDEQGKSFGVIRVYTKDEPSGYEIATYRKDISKGRDTKGDDVKVEIGSSITMMDDCLRRDLAINSLYYDIDNSKVIDLVGGIDDIKNKVIRSVGDAKDRFGEDRLRICRAFRFAARTGSKIDDNISNAIKNDNRLRGISSIDDVSQERIYNEIVDAWYQSKDFNYYLDLLTEYSMWDQIFPGVTINNSRVNCDDFIVNMANLFRGNDTKVLESKITSLFKLPNSLSSQICFLLDFLNLGYDNAFDLYKIKLKSHIETPTIEKWIDSLNLRDDVYRKFIGYKPTTSGHDLIKMGYKGAELGAKIKEIELDKFKKL